MLLEDCPAYGSFVRREAKNRPKGVIDVGGKLRNGLFLKSISSYDDRVAFEVFTSRPFRLEELEGLSLSDDLGTQYTMVVPEISVIDGHGQIEFRPALPDGALLRLSAPGWGLISYRYKVEP